MPSAQPPIHRRERPRHLINILYAVERDSRACERSSSSLDLWIHGEDTLGHQPSTNFEVSWQPGFKSRRPHTFEPNLVGWEFSRPHNMLGPNPNGPVQPIRGAEKSAFAGEP